MARKLQLYTFLFTLTCRIQKKYNKISAKNPYLSHGYLHLFFFLFGTIPFQGGSIHHDLMYAKKLIWKHIHVPLALADLNWEELYGNGPFEIKMLNLNRFNLIN